MNIQKYHALDPRFDDSESEPSPEPSRFDADLPEPYEPTGAQQDAIGDAATAEHLERQARAAHKYICNGK